MVILFDLKSKSKLLSSKAFENGQASPFKACFKRCVFPKILHTLFFALCKHPTHVILRIVQLHL